MLATVVYIESGLPYINGTIENCSRKVKEAVSRIA